MAGGGTASTANPAYTSRELAFQLKDCGAKFLVTTPESVDLAKEVAQDSGSLEEIFVIDVKQSDVPSGCTGFSQLMKDDGSALPSLQSTLFTKTDLAALPYSSGTTGLPKGVMLSHYNLLSNICQVTLPGLLKSRPEDKTSLAILPFFHAYGLAVILARDLEQGTKIVTMPKFEPEQYLKLLETHEVTRGFLVPPVMLFLAKHPMVDDYKLSSLTDLFSGAAPLSGEVTESIKKRLGITQVRQGYGLTETSPVTHLLPENVFKPGSVGIPVPNTECKVSD
jgi:acyl-CoA synthetase (AMP-forming)/AMP-acid ligase II